MTTASRDPDQPNPAANTPRAANGPNIAQEGGWRERRRERLKEQETINRAPDDAAYNIVTKAIADEETRDKILALGGDITRGSPVLAQALPDPDPGLTTTTGAYRTPIDPETAAVPMDKDDPKRREMAKGFPTVGSGREGGRAEELFKEPENDPAKLKAKK